MGKLAQKTLRRWCLSAVMVVMAIDGTVWFVAHWTLLYTAKVCHRIFTAELQKASRQDLASWAVQGGFYQALSDRWLIVST